MTTPAHKILILRLSSIGDIILTTPFVRQVRNAFPSAQIDFIAKKEFSDLLLHNQNISNVIKFNSDTGIAGLEAFNQAFKKEDYTYIFDLHNNLRTNRMLRGIKKNVFRINKGKVKRALLVYTKSNLYKKVVTIPERYLQVGQQAGVTDDGEGPELFWPKSIDENVNNMVKGEYICIAPGAGFYTKTWPVEYFNRLIEKIIKTFPMISVVLLGNKKEEELKNSINVFEPVKSMIGKTTLLETAAILKKSKLLICNDSGLMHMASAVNTPLIVIFGSTVKELGFYPYRTKNATIIENNDLWCRPCSHIGRKSCPLGHFKCMKSLTPDIVFETVKTQLLDVQ